MQCARLAFAFACNVILAGCASLAGDDLYFMSDSRYTVRYYDRNHDGTVDFAYYEIPGADDMEWALVDTGFSGRFDLKIHYGIAVGKYQLSHPIPVPTHVRIQRGHLPVYYP
jgi:hypothetical protein